MSSHDNDDDEIRPRDFTRGWDTFRFCWGYLRKRPYVFSASLLLGLTGTACDLFFPLLSGRIVDLLAQGYGTEGVVGKVYTALGLMVGFALLSYTLGVVGRMFWNVVQSGVIAEIACDATERVTQFSTDWHINNFAGATVRKITRGKWAFETVSDPFYHGILPTTVILLAITAVHFSHWPLMGAVFLCGFLIYVAISVFLSLRYVAPMNMQFIRSDSKLGGLLADTVSCNAVVKSFASERRESTFVISFVDKWRALLLRAWWRNSMTEMMQSGVLVVLMGVVVSLAVWHWSHGLSSPGQVIFTITGFLTVKGYIRSIGQQIRQLQKGVSEIQDVVEFSYMPSGIEDKSSAPTLVVPCGQIEFDRVGFWYQSQPKPLFSDLNLTIRPGEKVGLVGPSGSGKSSFVKLIQRLYDVTEGTIRIDGQDIASVTQQSLRHAVALVPQDPLLFHRTLAENIAYGRPDATPDEIIAAAKLAHAHEFISVLSKGYDTLVGERGVKLSGGERQRVAIARAILADKPILILDEATSSLDSISEHLIQEAMENLMKGRTTIVIAHRLSTIKKVDRILVFDQGKITEQGTHEELMRREDGHYRALFDMQSLGFVDEPKSLVA